MDLTNTENCGSDINNLTPFTGRMLHISCFLLFFLSVISARGEYEPQCASLKKNDGLSQRVYDCRDPWISELDFKLYSKDDVFIVREHQQRDR